MLIFNRMSFIIVFLKRKAWDRVYTWGNCEVTWKSVQDSEMVSGRSGFLDFPDTRQSAPDRECCYPRRIERPSPYHLFNPIYFSTLPLFFKSLFCPSFPHLPPLPPSLCLYYKLFSTNYSERNCFLWLKSMTRRLTEN